MLWLLGEISRRALHLLRMLGLVSFCCLCRSCPEAVGVSSSSDDTSSSFEARTPPPTPPPRRAKICFGLRRLTTKCKRIMRRDRNDKHDSSSTSEKKMSESEKLEDEMRKDCEAKLRVRPDICKIPVKDHDRLGLSLSGCGFLGTYHFGVVTCFLRNGQRLLSRLQRVSGASAGSLVAALLVLAPDELEQGLNTLYDLADELNSLKFGALSPGFFLNERLLKVVEDYLPQDISKAQNKLCISLTNHKTRQNRLVSEFDDREHLIRCLMASCYIPMYSMGIGAQPPEINGKCYIDGGYSNNLPDFPDLRTITVTPFSGSADISPFDPSILFEWKMTLASQHMKVNLRNIVRGAQALFPPSRANLQHYYSLGYKDAFKFLLDNDLLERAKGSSV